MLHKQHPENLKTPRNLSTSFYSRQFYQIYWFTQIFLAEAPEEEYDHRSLFDRLQEQKQKKDYEYEEAHKLSKIYKILPVGITAQVSQISEWEWQESMEWQYYLLKNRVSLIEEFYFYSGLAVVVGLTMTCIICVVTWN